METPSPSPSQPQPEAPRSALPTKARPDPFSSAYPRAARAHARQRAGPTGSYSGSRSRVTRFRGSSTGQWDSRMWGGGGGISSRRERAARPVRGGGSGGEGGGGVMAGATTAASPADKERFICIYPAYLNNKKTIAEGRRIPIDKAVENPTSTEIQDVCAAVGFNVLLEKNKMYPREWNRDVQYRGRVRIQLKQDDGNPCLPQFPTRKSVMLYAAETIPKLKTRTQKIGSNDQSLQQGEGGKKGKGKKKK